MPFISFAQNLEDVVLYRALKGITHGFYVDVGANSPDEQSVTSSLSDLTENGSKTARIVYFRGLY